MVVPVLVCADVTREEAEESIEKAEMDIQEMVEDDLPTSLVNDTLNEAREALKRADFAELVRENASDELAQRAREALEALDYQKFTYDEVVVYTNEISLKKQKTYGLMDYIRALEIKIADYKNQGINTTEAEKILESVKTSFENERFAETQVLLAEANLDLEDRKAEISAISLAVKSGKSFIGSSWKEILIFISLCTIAGMFGWKGLRTRKLRKKLEKMKIERHSLEELMKRIQVQRFKEGSIPESVYDIRMKKYEKRLNEIDHMMPTITKRLERENGRV